ncbi:SRP54-type protein [Tritrichomonas foetus]|uniref:Signal recognition particle receptor subunit alpha homolog n=1 Tax=Tritrichomonas foetus TaxID=1144522 RepID=A0A1J4KGK3_9EUKA|nr:SRP54-type protein [Tritrichomonas foetus]|eukprot:OHT10497.1 SRP54-type protein [Tritrichomonas foetus]
MFEFFIFQAGGLVLWPAECDSCSNVKVVNEYVQKQILEGHSTEGQLDIDKKSILLRHDTEYNIFFCVVLATQIFQYASYVPEMLQKVISTFRMQFQSILDKDEIVLLPKFFTSFSVTEIVNEFRGKTGAESNQPKPEMPRSNSTPQNMNNKNQSKKLNNKEKRPKSPDWRNKNKEKTLPDSVANSIIIQSDEVAEKEDIKTYDLDDFEGVFVPTNKPATGLANLFKKMVGEKILQEEDLQPVLEKFEQHLVNKNVAAHIAHNLTEAVEERLIGSKCNSFSSIKNIVSSSLREAIERILTPHRSLDLIRDIQNARSKGNPYVMAFIGVNGVGKSTSLSKVAYLFKSHGFKVLITACDTYRSGAVDQLGVHAKRLDIDLFQKGKSGEKRDPTPVAKDSIAFAKENHYDVVLIDTAGRMQNDDNLMKQIARLINVVKPDLTVFVAEALVGNNGSDQIQKFDLSLKTGIEGHAGAGIDGIILTKFDTIDDKVGAALTLVYETGHPIIYMGVGQHYRDLRRMNPEFVVSSLLAGF